MPRPLVGQRIYLQSGDVSLVSEVLDRHTDSVWTVRTYSNETIRVKSSDPYRPLVWEETQPKPAIKPL